MKRTNDPDLWCGQLEWLLRCADSAMGQRGTLAAVVSAIERGGSSSNGHFSHDAMLRAIGWREDEAPISREHAPVQRVRKLRARWLVLPVHAQQVLWVHYLPRNPADRVATLLGFCAAAAIHLSKDPDRLLRACERPSEGGSLQIRTEAQSKAEAAVRAAHAAWYGTAHAEAARWAEGA